MKIRYIVSMSGSDKSFPAFEKDNKGDWVFHEVDDLQAIRMVELERAVPQDKDEFNEIKSNLDELKAKKEKELKLAEDIAQLDELKARKVELESELEEVSQKIDSVNEALGNEPEENIEDDSEEDELYAKELLEEYKQDKSIVDDLKADDLKILCEVLGVTYTNVKDSKEALKILTIG